MKKIIGFGLLGLWVAKYIGLFRILSLMMVEDMLAIKIGALWGFSIINLFLIFGLALFLFHIIENKKWKKSDTVLLLSLIAIAFWFEQIIEFIKGNIIIVIVASILLIAYWHKIRKILK